MGSQRDRVLAMETGQSYPAVVSDEDLATPCSQSTDATVALPEHG